ncbi:TVP38/TMEM64 family protein [Gimesia maris]|uniref:TVP38/TMEM64 family protein n=1 Tax=Gimesia maris TaxID=122 RepID=UPI0032EDE658
MDRADSDSQSHDNEASETQTLQPAGKPGQNRTAIYLRVILLIALAGIAGMVYFQYRDLLTLKYLATQEDRWQDFAAKYPVSIYLVAFLIYTGITGLSLPGAVPLTLSYGWFFGFWKGLLLVSFASTAGATLAFLTSRYLFRAAIQNRYSDRFTSFNRQFEKEGAFYLFTLRLVVAVPFFLINLLMGLTTIRVWTFWWVSQLGMLAGTAVYVYAGTSVPTLQELSSQGARGILSPQLIIAFILLGTFPLLVKKSVNRLRKQT